MQGSARIDELRQKFHENPRRYFAPLANEYRKAGDPEQAIAICRAHLAQQPGHMSGHVVYGQALYDADRIDESRTVFEKALSLDPDNAIVLRQLGDIARQRGETAEAKHWYGRALDADPNDSEVAAYIAELTEPLTESATTDQVTTEAVTSEVSAEPPAEVQDAPVAAEEASDEPATDASSTESASEASTGQRDARTDTPVATPFVPLADVAWRKTPPHEDSPFVTRTMAELYAKQGYRAAALDVYRKLALTNPDDRDILARIEELTREPGSVAEPRADAPPSVVVQPEMEAGQPVDAAEGSEPDAEPAEISAAEAAEPTEAEAAEPAVAPQPAETAQHAEATEPAPEAVPETPDAEPVRALDLGGLELGMEAPVDWSDVSDNADSVYTPSAEELDEDRELPPPPDGRHFTELELAAGDSWDTDTWGAGFSADESTDLELDVPDTPILNLGLPAVDTVESASAPPSQEPVAEPESAAPADPVAQHEAVAQNEPGAQHEPADQPVPAPETETVAETEAVTSAGIVAETAIPETGAAVESEPVVDATDTVTASEPDTPAEEEIAAVAEERGTAIPAAETASAEEPVLASADADVIADEPVAAASSEFVARESEESVSTVDSLAPAAAAESEPETFAESPASEHEQDDEPHLVAYSPQPPDDEDLAHYEPRGPTVREFFATLGARRPPTHESNQSFTARAAVPAHDNPSDYPLAASAFADLFPDSPIAEEDTRAAFALSGAMSSTPSGVPAPSPAEPVRKTPSAAAPPVENAQESEEDIRRFREWLDGLAES